MTSTIPHGRPMRASDSLEDSSWRLCVSTATAKLVTELSACPSLRFAVATSLRNTVSDGVVEEQPPSDALLAADMGDDVDSDAGVLALELMRRFDISPVPKAGERGLLDAQVRAMWLHVDRCRNTVAAARDRAPPNDIRKRRPPVHSADVLLAMRHTNKVNNEVARTLDALGTDTGGALLGVAEPLEDSDEAVRLALRLQHAAFAEAQHEHLQREAARRCAVGRRLIAADGNVADAVTHAASFDAASRLKDARRSPPHNRFHVKRPGDRFGHVPELPVAPTSPVATCSAPTALGQYSDTELAREKLKLLQFYAHVAPRKSETDVDGVLRHYGPPHGFKIMWEDLYRKYCFAPLRELNKGVAATDLPRTIAAEHEGQQPGDGHSRVRGLHVVSPRQVTFATEAASSHATTAPRPPGCNATPEDEAERRKWKNRIAAFYALAVPLEKRKSDSQIDELMDRYRDEMAEEADGAPYELMMRHLIQKYGRKELLITEIITSPVVGRSAAGAGEDTSAALHSKLRDTIPEGAVRNPPLSMQFVATTSPCEPVQRPVADAAGPIARGVMTLKLAFVLVGFDHTVYFHMDEAAKEAVRRAFEVDVMRHVEPEIRRVLDLQYALIADQQRTLTMETTNVKVEAQRLTAKEVKVKRFSSSKSLWSQLKCAEQHSSLARQLQRTVSDLPTSGQAVVTRVLGGTIVNVDLSVPHARGAVASITEHLVSRVEAGEFVVPALRQAHRDSLGIISPRLAVVAVSVFGGTASADFSRMFTKAALRDPSCSHRRPMKDDLVLPPTMVFDILQTNDSGSGDGNGNGLPTFRGLWFVDDQSAEDHDDSVGDATAANADGEKQRPLTLLEVSEALLRESQNRQRVASLPWSHENRDASAVSEQLTRRKRSARGSEYSGPSIGRKRFVDSLWETDEVSACAREQQGAGGGTGELAGPDAHTNLVAGEAIPRDWTVADVLAKRNGSCPLVPPSLWSAASKEWINPPSPAAGACAGASSRDDPSVCNTTAVEELVDSLALFSSPRRAELAPCERRENPISLEITT